jgi:hypothetical protein
MAHRTPPTSGLAVSPNAAATANDPAADVVELQAHRFWGRYTLATQLPNGSANLAGAPSYTAMRPGDVAWAAGELYTLSGRGTLSGGDAAWAVTGSPFAPAPDGLHWDTSEEIHIGTPESPAALWIGGGGPFDGDRIQVWTEDGGGAFVNVSANNDLDTLAFPALTANNAIYISGRADLAIAVALVGAQHTVVTAMVVGAGSVTVEYWDGSAWVEFAVMITDQNPPLLPFADEWLRQTGAKNLRINQAITADWTANDPMAQGQSDFWFRFRVVTTITTGPVFGSVKGILDATKFGVNSFMELFGLGRVRREMAWDLGLLRPAASSPANQDVYLSDTLDVGRVENQFNNGATDRISFVSKVPSDLCTSCALRFGFNWMVDGISAGDVRWVLRWAIYKSGDSVYETAVAAPVTAPGQQEIVEVITAPVAVESPVATFFLLDVRTARARYAGTTPPDGIWISLEREGGHAGDTNTDNAIAIQVAGDYVAWSGGGYIGT